MRRCLVDQRADRRAQDIHFAGKRGIPGRVADAPLRLTLEERIDPGGGVGVISRGTKTRSEPPCDRQALDIDNRELVSDEKARERREGEITQMLVVDRVELQADR